MTEPSMRPLLGFGPPAANTGPPVLFMSSNGVGMGHLTRLLAVALRCEPRVRPHFFSLSTGAAVIDDFELPWEHLTSYTAPGIGRGTWERVLRSQVLRALDQTGARTLVFDGVTLYPGMVSALRRRDDVRMVWLRRGLWRQGRPAPTGTDVVDLVVEPGELDPSPSPDAAHVGPITLLDPSQLASRALARAELGVEADARVLLLGLSGGGIDDVSEVLPRAMGVLADHDWVVLKPRSPLPVGVAPDRLDVRTFTSYPMARLFPAFDAAISAAGYNSFHELLRARVPTLFIPLHRGADDQAARARQGEAAGMALRTPARDVADGVVQLLNDHRRRRLRQALEGLEVVNGAHEAADLVCRVAQS